MEDTKEGVVKDLENKDKQPEKMRQIVIETNGDDIKLIKAEVSGRIELIAILQNLVGYLNSQK